MKRCVVGIRPADAPDATASGKQVPTVWFPSMATLAAVLSEDNRALLRLIRNPCGDEAEGLLQDLSLRDALVDYQTATG